MAILIQSPDPNVHYAGKTYPKDKAPYHGDPSPDPNVPYNGAVFPRDAIKAQPPTIDPTNLPSLVVLGTLAAVVSPFNGVVSGTPPITGSTLPNGAIVLPADVMIKHDLEKVVEETGILDGVAITEHIRRKSINIFMEFTIRAKNGNDWIFGQQFLDDLFQKIIYPSSIIFVQNTLLNKIGITQMVLIRESGTTIRGSINQPMALHFLESVPGQSLIVS